MMGRMGIMGLLLAVVLATAPAIARADGPVGAVVEKVKNPNDWLGRKALKYGYIVTICTTNSLRMAREADEFDSRDLLGTNSHHLVDLGIVAGCILIGWEVYAILERDSWNWQEKTALIGAGLSLARETGEFTYQGMRHGDPFNNNPEYHQSELFWVGKRTDFPWVQDDMIGTGRIGTPAVHLGFTALGANLIGRVH